MIYKNIQSLGLSVYSPDVDEVVSKGKGAYVKKPPCSPCCHATLWGHGWRRRWVDDSLIYVWRLICAACRKSLTFLPKGLWPRFQTKARSLLAAVRLRLYRRRWAEAFTRQRMRWWVRVARHRLKSEPDLLKKNARLGLWVSGSRPPLSRSWLPHPTVS